MLNLPALQLGYFWDDFYFLTFHARLGEHSWLLPDPHFFRPIPLVGYFGLLRLVDPVYGHAAHGLSLALLAVAVVLLVRFVSILSSPRAGLFAGLIFVGYAQVSSLVSWVSACTDLLAILFLVAAFLLRHQGRNLAALACAAAALLSKETAIAAFPVLVLWDWLLGRPRNRPWLQVGGYAAIAAGWAILHPGVRGLVEHGFHRGSAAYVGVQPSQLWAPHLVRYLMALVNLPPLELVAGWPQGRVIQALLAFVAVVAGLAILDRHGSSISATPLRRVALLTALFWVPTAAMPAVMVQHWAPYLACIPALGTSIVLGTLLAGQPRLVAVGALGLFLILGARARGIRGEREAVLSEPLMVEASQAVRTVRANFRTVFPSLPRGCQIVASVGTRGLRGIQGALFEGQALRVWYRDPTLRTVRIMARRPDAASEHLVRVTNGLDVIAIDPATRDIRASAAYEPGLDELDQPVVDYARALAAAGDFDPAIRAMTNLSLMERGDFLARNDRIIASMLLAAGRDEEADSILASAAPFSVENSREVVLSFLTNPSPSEALDLAALEAFGFSASDPGTLRWIIEELRARGRLAEAARFARMLLGLVPGDREASMILETAAGMGIQPGR
ncbi:MAG: hypothetical protein ACM3JJ_00915 [Hyphomicrobiales bacterium]